MFLNQMWNKIKDQSMTTRIIETRKFKVKTPQIDFVYRENSTSMAT